MATKKVETKAAETVKTEATVAASIVEVKKAVPAVKKEAEKPVVKAEIKEEAAPAAKKAPAKTEAKKAAPAEKKPAAKKDPKASVVVEYAGKQIKAKDILDQAKKAFTKANKGVEIKTIELYVKPEENVAYYVVNGMGSDDYKVIL